MGSLSHSLTLFLSLTDQQGSNVAEGGRVHPAAQVREATADRGGREAQSTNREPQL